MTKRESVIGIILLLLAAFCAYVFFGQNKRTPVALEPKAAQPQNVEPGKAAAPSDGQKDIQRMIDKVFLKFAPPESAGEIADPFKKFDSRDLMDRSILEFSELKLIGIILDEEAVPVALINDQILRVDEEISGFKVTEIRTNEVALTRGLEKYTLKLFEE